ncbi:MAG: DNA repair protein RecN [Bacteroidales bacterium]|nr:DNA repair protein RecN [Bacteroidales bacterium]
MIRNLLIRNYILIDSLEISFPEGLVIITGQTGAGKSIILGALSLVLGGKADASLIAEGAENCVVEAEFTATEDLKEMIEEAGAEWNEDGTLVIRRVIYASGRSRSFINDAPVQLPLLSELSGRLVDIHSQHRTLLLSDHSFQLSLLDHYAGNADSLKECRDIFSKLTTLKAELAEVNSRLRKVVAEKEYNQARFKQLDDAKLRDGELEELDVEQKQLAHAEQIKESLSRAQSLFSSEDGSSISSSLKEICRTLQGLSKYIPSLEELSSRVESSRLELEDIESEVEDLNSSTELSEERLAAVEDRMGLLYDLMQKHACTSIAELITARDEYSAALFDSETLENRRDELVAEIDRTQAGYDKVAAKLHKNRLAKAEKFSLAVRDSIRSLELEKAVFNVEILPCEPGRSGIDSVRFLFSSNGTAPADIAKCASGGEMSRIMLCLKAMMARYAKMPAMVFDEIDTGVSGSVADKMGSMICEMGKDMQVFAITHLPQVAAKGQAHYLVVKNDEDGKNVTTIKKLSPEERVYELARMLSGSKVTEAAVSNARSLIGEV